MICKVITPTTYPAPTKNKKNKWKSSTKLSSKIVNINIPTKLELQLPTTELPVDTRKGPIADSGASVTMIRESDIDLLTDIDSKGGVGVAFGGGTVAESIGTGSYAPIPMDVPIESHRFRDKDLVESLSSLHDFCSKDLAVVLTDDAMLMLDKNNLIIKREDVKLYEPKEKSEPLWRFARRNISDKLSLRISIQRANNVIHSDLDAEYVKMVHAALGSPTVSTFKRAMAKGWLGNLPRLTLDMIRKNPPYSEATSKGHLDRRRKNQRSTKRKGKAYREKQKLFIGEAFTKDKVNTVIPADEELQIPTISDTKVIEHGVHKIPSVI